MARLIPRVNLEEIAVKSERDVAHALVNTLPADVVIYHSYPWLRANRHSDGGVTLNEGETDFVVVDPEYGILILEVKGGQIDYDAPSRTWLRVTGGGMRKQITDPFEQARKGTHFLKDQIQRISFPQYDSLPCVFGHAVCFPDCRYQGPPPPGGDHAIILSAGDLPHLGRKVREVFSAWSRQRNPSALTKEEMDGVLKGLAPSFQLLPVLFRQIAEQEEKLFRLTAEQARLLDVLRNHDRAAIEGVAGSGKTMLARAQAEYFADQGQETLIVCYNKALAEWLRSSMAEVYREKITVRHFHGLCYDLCREAGFEWDPSDGDEFWRFRAPELMMQALDTVERRFDAVVVDEGQDFYADWWLPIELLNRQGEEGPFYVFYDPKQNLFVGDELSIPDLGKPFALPTNCRNTKEIARVCGQVRQIEIRVREDAPQGTECEVIVAPEPAQQQRAAQRVMKDWISDGKLQASQVAILSPHKKPQSSFFNVSELARIPLTPDLGRWQAGQGILFATVRSFKGLEADAILMVDVPPPDSEDHFSRADFYVGCSRAKHLLAILAKAEGAV